jgi:NAD(P)-dependent dehydrogenase (short-subunit alcohol dehydrogenase family)
LPRSRNKTKVARMSSAALSTALIIGVRGLGRTIARHFGGLGWRVIAAARTQATVDSVAEEVTAAGGTGVGITCDLQDRSSLRALVEKAGPIDLVIAAQTSGVRFGPRPFLAIDDGEVDAVFSAYVRGTWNLLKAVGPTLTAQKRGTFLQIGTSSGVRTRAEWAPLGTAQHGLRALVQVVAKEWRPHGVHVAYVPIDGGIRRDAGARASSDASRADIEAPDETRDEAPRSLDPHEIARACAYLHGQDRSAWTHELVLRPTGTDWSAPT